MSKTTFQQIPDALLSDRALKPADIKVYAALRSHLGENQYVFPSIRTLAKEINASASAVDRSIRNLRQQGHIVRKRAGNGRSARTYLKTLVRGKAVITGTPLPESLRPKRIIKKARKIYDGINEEMELYFIKEREENLAATFTEYVWEDCRCVNLDVPDTSNLTCPDTSPVTH